SAVGMDGEERWICSCVHSPKQLECSRARVEMDRRDALGAFRVGVAADVEQLLLVRHVSEPAGADAEEPERGRPEELASSWTGRGAGLHRLRVRVPACGGNRTGATSTLLSTRIVH